MNLPQKGVEPRQIQSIADDLVKLIQKEDVAITLKPTPPVTYSQLRQRKIRNAPVLRPGANASSDVIFKATLMDDMHRFYMPTKDQDRSGLLRLFIKLGAHDPQPMSGESIQLRDNRLGVVVLQGIVKQLYLARKAAVASIYLDHVIYYQ